MALIDFRPLTRSDFPQLGLWLEMQHVARWWNHDTAPDALERDFGPGVDGDDPAELFIVIADGTPCGFLQRYAYADNPGYLRDVRAIVEVPADAFSIDYFIGEPGMLRQGVGTATIRAAVNSMWNDKSWVTAVIVPVNAANLASTRLLERAGFRVAGYGALEPDNPVDGDDHVIFRIDRPTG